ncbi:MAG: hypothetical protein OEY14_16950 [Myxococcales bacterium]|nr:hypothetical protein [Myxococcales bacterium]
MKKLLPALLLAPLAWAAPAPALLQGEPAPARAWQQDEPYVAPDFEAYFPDDVEGGRALDGVYEDNTLRGLGDEQFLAVIRRGLRHTKNHRTLILSYVGNRFIWGKQEQNLDAIELCYHAADFREAAAKYGARHYAVYFGLSVVTNKTPAILRTLADLCVAIDDPNDIGRVAWGAASQMDELLPYLAPHLASEDAYVRAKAEDLQRIFRGELGAFAWAAERAKLPPRPRAWKELPEVRKTLREGDGPARLELLRRIRSENLTRDMNDSYLADFAVAAGDADPKVRAELTRTVGRHWIWGAGLHRVSDPAVDLMLRLSRDPEPDVRYQAVYYGLSTYRGEREDVLDRKLEMLLDPSEVRNHGRLIWSLHRGDERLAARLETLMRGESRSAAQAAYQLYRTVFEARPDFTPEGIAGPADLVGTWSVTLLAGGREGLQLPNLRVAQDEVGKLVLSGEELERLEGDLLDQLIYSEVGEVLHFSFHTTIETLVLRTTGRLEGDQIEGTSRVDGGDTLVVWTARRVTD